MVVDDDLGVSGARSQNRLGHHRLIATIVLREVGIVLGLEESCLARSNLDWYRLLELAAALDVLIADEGGVYKPREFNDWERTLPIGEWTLPICTETVPIYAKTFPF